MGKGNIAIDKSMVKTIVDGKIIIPLPKVLVGNRYYPMFSISSPTHCDDCGSKLHVNSHHTRFILSSHGTIACNVTYWICPSCKKSFHDQIIGVPGSANYSSEYYDRQMSVRYDGRCSLNNSLRIGETYTEGVINVCGRAPCPTLFPDFFMLVKYINTIFVCSLNGICSNRFEEICRTPRRS